MRNPPEPMPMFKRPEAMPRAMSPDSAFAIMHRFHEHITQATPLDDPLVQVAQAIDYYAQMHPKPNVQTVREACFRVNNDRHASADLQILADYVKSEFTT